MTVRELLDPTAERSPAERPRAPRPGSLEGITVGLLDISKARGDVFLDRIEERLRERNVHVTRFRKPTFTKVLPVGMDGEIALRAGVVIEALAD